MSFTITKLSVFSETLDMCLQQWPKELHGCSVSIIKSLSNFEQEVLRQILQWKAPGFLKFKSQCLDLISSFVMLKPKLFPHPLRYVAH